ncbi:hypothetical protein AWW66_17125 [Micromonospora rosaria]|uniref:Uncharacterized protein n=1 Tax=Micromonospora rosaria TaxID=47874 RepID=A0A136PQP3_9ACTN|nr:hypothetical protein [Micromonospora rosaria]KXK60785.1 hypothetical protein AWW66_17125 [Micromonospora rosaria]
MHARAREVTETSRSAPAPRRPQRPAGSADVQRLLSLQRTVGNQAVQAMMREDEPGPSRQPAGAWPTASWRDTIEGLRQGNGLLGPANGQMRRYRQNNAQLGPLIDQFVDSLLDPQRSPDDATRVLTQMVELLRRPAPNAPTGRGRTIPSSFPRAVYNNLKETVNAKRLWLGGDHTLHPWPFDADAKKPDYVLGEEPGDLRDETAESYYASVRDVGDHVSVTGMGTLDQVLDRFRQEVAGKVATYPGKQVRVVVDVADNHADRLWDDAPAALRDVFRERLGERSGLDARLVQVDVVLPGGEVITVYDRSGSPPPQSEVEPEVQVVEVAAAPVIDALVSSSPPSPATSTTPLLGDPEAQRDQPVPATLLARLRAWVARFWAALRGAFGQSS